MMMQHTVEGLSVIVLSLLIPIHLFGIVFESLEELVHVINVSLTRQKAIFVPIAMKGSVGILPFVQGSN